MDKCWEPICWDPTLSHCWANICCEYRSNNILLLVSNIISKLIPHWLPIFSIVCTQQKIQNRLSTLVKCWSNVWKKILVDKYFTNIWQMLGANMLWPNTKPMLSQYFLRIQIKQYTFVGFKHHLNINPTLVANIFDYLHPTKYTKAVFNIGQMLVQCWEKNYW